MKLVSEEIARAFAQPSRGVIAYDTPIVTREQHQSVVTRMEQTQMRLEEQVRELQRRLTAIRALPAPEAEDESGEQIKF